MTLVLRRLTCDVNGNTPHEVINWLCVTSGITEDLNYEDKIIEINEMDYPEISLDGNKWDEEDWRLIQRTVNPYVSWNSDKLVQALIHIFFPSAKETVDLTKEERFSLLWGLGRYGNRCNENAKIGRAHV